MPSNSERLAQDFGDLGELISATARAQPDRAAFRCEEKRQSYAETRALMDRVAAALQRDGVKQGEAIAICAATSIEYATLFLGAISIGVVVTPLAPSSTKEQLAAMVSDCGARLLFLDATTAGSFDAGAPRAPHRARRRRIAARPSGNWLAPAGAPVAPAHIRPQDAFNIIYSSGTTGVPKGIVQPCGMRWLHMQRAPAYGYDDDGGDALLDAALFQHHAEQFLPGAGRAARPRADEEIRRAPVSWSWPRRASRDPCHARSRAISAASWPSRISTPSISRPSG